MLRRIVIVCTWLSLSGCGLLGSKPSAMDVCKKLEVAKVASGCREDKPIGVGAAAAEKVAFDLPSVPGKGGQVLRFDKPETYKQTADTFEKTALLAGPHRYGNEGKLIFVQFNDGASLDIGKQAKAIVEGL